MQFYEIISETTKLVHPSSEVFGTSSAHLSIAHPPEKFCQNWYEIYLKKRLKNCLLLIYWASVKTSCIHDKKRREFFSLFFSSSTPLVRMQSLNRRTREYCGGKNVDDRLSAVHNTASLFTDSYRLRCVCEHVRSVEAIRIYDNSLNVPLSSPDSMPWVGKLFILAKNLEYWTVFSSGSTFKKLFFSELWKAPLPPFTLLKLSSTQMYYVYKGLTVDLLAYIQKGIIVQRLKVYIKFENFFFCFCSLFSV